MERNARPVRGKQENPELVNGPVKIYLPLELFAKCYQLHYVSGPGNSQNSDLGWGWSTLWEGPVTYLVMILQKMASPKLGR